MIINTTNFRCRGLESLNYELLKRLDEEKKKVAELQEALNVLARMMDGWRCPTKKHFDRCDDSTNRNKCAECHKKYAFQQVRRNRNRRKKKPSCK